MNINEEILCKIICGSEFHSKLHILNWNVIEDVSVVRNNCTYKLSNLTVEYKRKSKIFRRHFCLKIPSIYPICSTAIKHTLFDKEYLAYTTILEAMHKIDEEHIGPKFYYADEKHSIILKDLTQSGYKRVDRIEQLDFNQCYIVFKYLARFHALSVKLDQMVEINPMLKECIWIKITESEEQMKELINYSYDQFVVNIGLDPDLNQKYKNKLIQLRDSILNNAIEEVKPDKYKFRVLNHGDCWTGNVLFKFDKYGLVQKAKLTDFHGTSWTTPAYDILRFTISSMKFEVYEKQFDLLLDIYVTTLNQILNYFECETFELMDLKKDLDNMTNYAIIMFSCFLPKYISSLEDPLDVKNVIKNDVFDLSALNRYFENEFFLSLSKKWFLHFANKGIFD